MHVSSLPCLSLLALVPLNMEGGFPGLLLPSCS